MRGPKKSRKSPARPRTQRQKVETKEAAILSAAREIMAVRGYGKTTTAEIAAAANVAEGTLYLYFENKEGLAQALLADFYRRITQEALRGVAELSASKDKFAFLARHHLKNIMKERRILEMRATLERDSDNYKDGELFKMNRAYVAVFDEVVREAIARGEIDATITPWIYRDIFYGALEYAMRTMLIKGREKSVEKVVAELIDLVTRKKSEQPPSPASQQYLDAAARVENAAHQLEKLLTAQTAKGE